METQGSPVSNPGRRVLGPLASEAIPSMDRVVPGLRPGRPAREFAANATLVARQNLTASVARFVVRPDGGVPPFKPGQYFALGLRVDGAPLLQRPYSTASPAGAVDELEFLIRRIATGAFTPRLWGISPEARVWLGPPRGLFTLRPDDRRTHLLVATGTGLAPFISMADTLLRTEPTSAGDARLVHRPVDEPRVVVVHGVSHRAELAYRERLETWARAGRLAYVPTLSRPADPANAGWTGATGRTETVLARVCETLEIDPERSVAYVCGNPGMIEAVTEVLRGRGFAETAVVREHYWTAGSSEAA